MPQPLTLPSPGMLIPSSRTPRAFVAGMTLTQDQADRLSTNVEALQELLKSHFSAIQTLGLHDAETATYLLQIGDRQKSTDTLLTQLVEDTKHSTALWVHEIADAHEAVLKKLYLCKQKSLVNEMGVHPAAAKYWPLVRESYEVMVPLLKRLTGEIDNVMADQDKWKRGGKLVKKRLVASSELVSAVEFSKEVRARWVPIEAEFTSQVLKDGKVPLVS